MNLLDYFVWLISGMIIFSKFLDCITTVRKIKFVYWEQNPIARKLMNTFGVSKTVWGVFILTVLTVALSQWLVMNRLNTATGKILYIILGGIITLTHILIAWSNHTGRLNFFTRMLNEFYSRFAK